MGAHGVSLRAVQMIGGWTSLRMVERYAHLDDAELQPAVRLTHNHAEAAKQGGQKGIQRPEQPMENLKMRMASNREGSANYELASPTGPATLRKPLLTIGLDFDGAVPLAA